MLVTRIVCAVLVQTKISRGFLLPRVTKGRKIGHLNACICTHPGEKFYKDRSTWRVILLNICILKNKYPINEKKKKLNVK